MFAYPDELRAWLVRERSEGRTPAPSGRRKRWILAVSAAMIALALLPVAWSRTRRVPSPAQFTIAGGDLVARDTSGRIMWTRPFGSTDVQPSGHGCVEQLWGAYVLAVLDAAAPNGRSPEPPGSETECVSCPPGDPLRYVVFPRTDVGREQPFPSGGPAVHTFGDGAVQVHVMASGDPNAAATVYELSSDFSILGAGFNDAYWEWHRRLEHEGRLTHERDSCPHLHGLEVRLWTPKEGWHSAAVSAAGSWTPPQT